MQHLGRKNNSRTISETVEKPFNGVILSEAKNLTKHSFETLHCVQVEIVDRAFAEGSAAGRLCQQSHLTF
jgi:hypothetical protein